MYRNAGFSRTHARASQYPGDENMEELSAGQSLLPDYPDRAGLRWTNAPGGVRPWRRANDPCLMAQEANYSCAALRNDLGYLQRTRQGSEALDSEAVEDDCAGNKRNLSEYDKRVEEMSVLIQWYRIFAHKGF